jgi:hypothetical protein
MDEPDKPILDYPSRRKTPNNYFEENLWILFAVAFALAGMFWLLMPR